MSALSLFATADPTPVYAGNGQLVLACLLGIATVVVLITAVTPPNSRTTISEPRLTK